jgi:hypothetical protein
VDLAWVTRDGTEALCVSRLGAAALDRLRATAPAERAALLRVLPLEALGANRSPRALPATAGTVHVEGTTAVFVPRFGFVDGCSYVVVTHPEVGGPPGDGGDGGWPTITRPTPEREPVTVVEAIHPAAPAIPLNTLRLYVSFARPMAEGFAAQVRVLDGATGEPVPNALLPMDQELWDPARRRLTVLFDPGRIKRGLVPHAEAGYPLREGTPVRVEVGAGFLDASGAPLAEPAQRTYQVGPLLEGRVDVGTWTLEVPSAGTRRPLRVGFGRPLDHALLQHALAVAGVAGVGTAIGGGTGWTFVPDAPWAAGPHRLAAEAILEDVAGNSVARPFDRDLSVDGGPVRPAGRAERTFLVARKGTAL